MPFIEIKGLPGKVYVPDNPPDILKKNQCPDCFSCQNCCDTRCLVCLNRLHNHKINECIEITTDDENKTI